MMASGCIGILVGGMFAGRVPLPAVSLKSYRGSLKFCCGSLLISAALLVVVALVVTACVVPPVKADTFLGAAPERAVPVLWWGVALSVLIAMLLVFIAIRATDRTRLSHAALGILAFFAFVLAFLLIPPAFAYQSHGPAMQTASILLFLCAASELFAAVLVILVMFLLREGT
jgi:cytochrome bd-type quinol oxidase subunit 2